MLPSHYASLELAGIELTELRDEYLDWVLGLGQYRQKRRDRENLGVRREWTTESLTETGTSSGRHDCVVALREDDDKGFLLRFTHRDGADPSVLWHNMVRGSQLGQSVRLEHGVARTFPRGVVLPDVAAPPRVLAQISQRSGIELVRPKSLFHKDPVRLAAGEVDGFVRHVLVDAARELPYVMVSADEADAKPLVDPSRLARGLLTLAAVAVLEDDQASREFGRVMKGLGFPERFGHCFNGAVRVFEAPLLRDQSPYQHYLWLGDRIRAMDAGDPTRALAGEIASRCALAKTPVGFFRAIEAFDRQRTFLLADRLLQKTAPDSEQAPEQVGLLEKREAELTELRSSLQTAVGDREIWEQEATEREAEVAELRRRLGRAEQDRDSAQARVHFLATALERANHGDGEEHRDAYVAAIAGDPTLEQALIVLERLYPDRLVVLPSAIEAARESVAFRQRAKAWELLRRLPTDYWEKIREGGDAQARLVFGPGPYAATESETVMSNANAMRLRTFDYKGEALQMVRHLKIGNKDSVADTLRVHFHVVTEDADGDDVLKVVIGHCGRHLDFK